jgi:ribosomal protein S18 acetylase RimI-like enzyme
MILEWRNSGLGSSLLATVIEWARKNPILELLWLQVYTDNQLGLALYEKMGFIDNGTIKNFFKKDGQYSHVKTMSLSLK